MSALRKWMEITFVLVFVFLVLKRARGFASGIRAISGGYVEAVRALQGQPR